MAPRPLILRPLRRRLPPLLLLASATAAAYAEPHGEYEVKAAFLYNFTKFVEWPAAASRGLTLCVLGDDPFGPTLDLLEGKPAANGTVKVKRIRRAGEAGQCRLVFVSTADSATARAALEGLKGVPVLTAGEAAGFASDGGMIGLYVEGGKVVFDINLGAARAAGLTISSQLLRLARRVHGGTP